MNSAPAYITLSADPETVPVAVFRGRIAHLEKLINVDRHSCANERERERWARAVRRIGSELIATTCRRATAEDWERRERIIDRSTDLLTARFVA